MDHNLIETDEFDEDFAQGGEVEYEELEAEDESEQVEQLDALVRAARLAGA